LNLLLWRKLALDSRSLAESRCADFLAEEKPSMALVLCTGVNPLLMQTRKMILEEAGHRVVTAQSEPEVKKRCEEHTFDVAVIGQAVSHNEKSRLFSIIRRHCGPVRVLELY
jgi:DNA-binding NtrC family response regulator